MSEPSRSRDETPRLPWYAARIWFGCDPRGLLRLLWRNRFRVGGKFIHVALLDLLAGCVHLPLSWLQEAIYGRRLARVKLQPPLFVLGHWRTGTTLLHELLIQDPRHVFPNTYQCFVPHHFLLSEWLVTRLAPWSLPRQRPMDNMALAFDLPQEDEFALANSGVPSPYWKIAFPNRPSPCPEYLNLERLPPRELARWKRALTRFLTRVAFRRPGRLVLKSPPHTGRLATLAEMFPGARFVHLVPDPRAVFPSTLRLWKALYAVHGLQTPTYAGLEEEVFSTLVEMYQAFDAARERLPAGQLCELRYEDLIADPIAALRRVYQELDLGEFTAAEPAVNAYLAQHANYQTNRHSLDATTEARILERWQDYARRYGYLADSAASGPDPHVARGEG